jgi:hypothetical protein
MSATVCQHRHLVEGEAQPYCLHCGKEFENKFVWRYGALWFWR